MHKYKAATATQVASGCGGGFVRTAAASNPASAVGNGRSSSLARFIVARSRALYSNEEKCAGAACLPRPREGSGRAIGLGVHNQDCSYPSVSNNANRSAHLNIPEPTAFLAPASPVMRHRSGQAFIGESRPTID